MKQLLNNTMFKLVILIIVGIVISNRLIISVTTLMLFCCAIFLILLFFCYQIDNLQCKTQNIFIIVNLILLGILLELNANQKFYNYEIATAYNQFLYVNSEAKETDKFYKYTCTSILKGVPDTYLYVEKISSLASLRGRYVAIIGGQTNIIENYDNADFDYKKFAFRRGVGYSIFTSEEELYFTRDMSKTLRGYFYNMQRKFYNKLKTYSPNNDLSSVAGAIILGIDDLDPELRESFSSSGIIHVLCVSGLHVSLVYFIILSLFYIFKSVKVRHIIAPLTAMFVVWLYALITGLSPAVLRATIMHSAVTIGLVLRKDAIIINSLCCAALIMILINPNKIFNIGFQLSYLAVLGIVLFANPIMTIFSRITNYIKIKSIKIITEKLLKLIAVSIAVQLTISPILMYYFKTFSNYFIFGNIIAIPIATAILYFGLITLLIPSSIVFKVLSKLLYFFVYLLNAYALFIQQLPLSVSLINTYTIIHILMFLIIVSIIKDAFDKGFSAFRIQFCLFALCCILGLNIFMNSLSDIFL